jgi:hypothetical protein
MSTLPKGATGYLSGTSMAAPMVSGAAALLLSVGGPDMTTARLRQLLMDTAVRTEGLSGRVLSVSAPCQQLHEHPHSLPCFVMLLGPSLWVACRAHPGPPCIPCPAALLPIARATCKLGACTLQGRLDVDAALARYRLEAQTVLPKSAFCKANPTRCHLVCDKKKICTHVRKTEETALPQPLPASRASQGAGSAAPAAGAQSPPLPPPQPQQQRRNMPARRLMAGN